LGLQCAAQPHRYTGLRRELPAHDVVGFSRPHGIAIHPNGDKVVFSHNTFAMAEYTISTGQWRPILFSYYDEVLEVNVVYLDGIYGIEWSPNGDYLYAAARGGVAEIVADPDGSLTNTVRCQAGFNAFSTPWDVAIVGADAGVQLVATDDDWMGPYNPRARRVGLYAFDQPQAGCQRTSTLSGHPEADRGGILFGIEHAPDGTFWMTNYDRGLLYQLAVDGTLLRRVQVGNQKVGVGLAILPMCWSHDGMSTATAASMTLTCWRCCSTSAARSAAFARTRTATGLWTTPTC
jgi:hypothetical protein